MSKENEKEYIYITKQTNELTRCKIGMTQKLKSRQNTYNSTGHSVDNSFEYLFVGEVQDMRKVEKDLKEKYYFLREKIDKEVYLYNSDVFKFYVDFIKSHPLFIKEIFIEIEYKITIKNS